jgi:hypothetical protein
VQPKPKTAAKELATTQSVNFQMVAERNSAAAASLWVPAVRKDVCPENDEQSSIREHKNKHFLVKSHLHRTLIAL